MKVRKDEDRYRIIDPKKALNQIPASLLYKIHMICQKRGQATADGIAVCLDEITLVLSTVCSKNTSHNVLCIFSSKRKNPSCPSKNSKIMKLENGMSVVWDGAANIRKLQKLLSRES